MAKTYLDQLVEYPAKIIKKISEDKDCVGLIVNKGANKVTEDDSDTVLDENIFDYRYVDETTKEAAAYIWVEMEVPYVDNKHIKGTRIYVTVACHKNFMRLNGNEFRGMTGNRRDNLVRYVDRLLNESKLMGIGALSLKSVKTLTPINGFVMREITYSVPDFNIVEIDE